MESRAESSVTEISFNLKNLHEKVTEELQQYAFDEKIAKISLINCRLEPVDISKLIIIAKTLPNLSAIDLSYNSLNHVKAITVLIQYCPK